MSICDLGSSITRIQRATKELRDKWQETRQYWNDQTAAEFEATHLDSIIPQLRLLAAELSELRETYDRGEKECRDDMNTWD